MAVQRRLDRKARTAVTVAVVLLLAAPVLAVWSYISSNVQDHPIINPDTPDNRLVFLKNGTILLLEHGSIGRKIADWLKVKTTDEQSFELSDDTFAPASAELTPAGWTHLVQFVQVLKAHRGLKTRIVVSVPEGTEDRSLRQLEETRAHRLRSEIISRGVPEAEVTTATQPAASLSKTGVVQHAPDHSQLFVLLSRA
jgi:hypothetical protein